VSALESVFTTLIPQLLNEQPGSGSARVGFIVTSGDDQGYWVVSLSERTCRRGTESDQPEVVVEAHGAVLTAFFRGELDIAQAVQQGALKVDGTVQALAELASAMLPLPARNDPQTPPTPHP
jgi:putative sterol carrier protein